MSESDETLTKKEKIFVWIVIITILCLVIFSEQVYYLWMV